MSEFTDLVTSERPRKVTAAPGGKSGALLATYENGMKAVVKVAKSRMPSGHRRQRGIPVNLHPAREVAFYRAAQLCAELSGTNDVLVPETVLTNKVIPGSSASAQLFVPAQHIDQLRPVLKNLTSSKWGRELADACLMVPKIFWKRLLVVDILGGVRDRHSNNVGLRVRVIDDQPTYRVVAWDNAVSFGKAFNKYHNVFHKHIFRKSVDLGAEWAPFDRLTRADLRYALDDYLEPDEIEHAFLRTRFFGDFPYRLPWNVCSRGSDDPHGFPGYDDYFDKNAGPLNMTFTSA